MPKRTESDARPMDEQRLIEEHERDKQEGDVLGISRATADIPRATPDRGGNPAGIELDEERPGSREVRPKRGATSIDMGAGGEGHDVKHR